MKFLHPSWHFYALIFGVITGIAFFTVSGQPLFRSLSWFVLVLVLVLIALFIPCRITLPIAFAAGFLLAGFRFSPELADRLTLASFVGPASPQNDNGVSSASAGNSTSASGASSVILNEVKDPFVSQDANGNTANNDPTAKRVICCPFALRESPFDRPRHNAVVKPKTATAATR